MSRVEQALGKFRFIEEWPSEVLLAVSESLRGLEWLVPPWCHEVLVTWDDSETGCLAAAVQYDYRLGRINVFNGFLTEDKQTRKHHMRHELLHLFTCVPLIYSEQVVTDILKGDGNALLRERVLAEMREKHEGAVCDLEYCLRGVSSDG